MQQPPQPQRDKVACFACGELNTPDSRFCKFCGRPLVTERQRPTVTNDPRNRLMLWLVIVLLVACMAFGVLGLVTSKFLRGGGAALSLPPVAIMYVA